jgi:hypothetical protein
MLGMGFVKDWTHLLACRFLLGLLESGELLLSPFSPQLDKSLTVLDAVLAVCRLLPWM